MKRLLLTFTTLLIFAFAMSGTAHALLWGDPIFWHTESANVGFTSVTYADGTTKDYSKMGTLGIPGYTFVNDNELFIYQSDANAAGDPSKYEAHSINYYHSTYFNVYNSATTRASDIVSANFHWEMNFYNTAALLAKDKQTVSTDITFYNWNDGSASYMVFTEVAWSLGVVTDAKGNEYNLYLELKYPGTFTPEEIGYTVMTEGAVYDQMVADLGLTSGTPLYYWYTTGASQHMAFQLSAFNANVDPYATPIPGAVWLMGTGVAGLIALRRRNS